MIAKQIQFNSLIECLPLYQTRAKALIFQKGGKKAKPKTKTTKTETPLLPCEVV